MQYSVVRNDRFGCKRTYFLEKSLHPVKVSLTTADKPVFREGMYGGPSQAGIQYIFVLRVIFVDADGIFYTSMLGVCVLVKGTPAGDG